MTTTDSSLLEITYGSRGIVFTPKAPRTKSRAVTEEATAEEFATPFAGSVHEDLDKITVGDLRGDSAYQFRDTITIGLDTLHKSVAEDSPIITETSFVYYEITKLGSTIAAVLKVLATYPIQEHGTLNIILGKALFNVGDGEVELWTQYHFGDISMHGRFA